jgi:hypothetical protein
MAAWGIAHIDHIAQSVGGVVDATVGEVQAIGCWLLAIFLAIGSWLLALSQTTLRGRGFYETFRRRGRLRSN